PCPAQRARSAARPACSERRTSGNGCRGPGELERMGWRLLPPDQAHPTTPTQPGLEPGAAGYSCCRVPGAGTDLALSSRSDLLEGVDDLLFKDLGFQPDIASLQAKLEALHVLAHFLQDLAKGDRGSLRLQHADSFGPLNDNILFVGSQLQRRQLVLGARLLIG